MTDGKEDAKTQRETLMKAERKGRKKVEKMNERLERLEVEYVPIDWPKPNDYNPNRQSEHDFELLLRSMEEDGFTTPIPVLPDGTIVDGEHRWRAAMRLGYSEIPVVKTPMTPEQAKIATLRHNRARGSEDLELSVQVLRDLQELGAMEWAQDSLIISDLELQRLLEDIPAPEAMAADAYGDAWNPDKTHSSTHEMTLEGREQDEGDSGTWVYAGTASAVDAARERERQLREAKTDEQREIIKKDSAKDFYRVSLTFYGDEASVVKRALGSAPAEALSSFCRKELGEMERMTEGGWVLIDTLFTTRAMPSEAAGVVQTAIEMMVEQGAVDSTHRWMAIEFMAAEWLAGQRGADHAEAVADS
jgi:ParB-like chromosome segregation protein Spo0J